MPGLLVAGIRKKYRCWSDPNVSCCQPSGPFPPYRVLDIFPLHRIEYWPVSSSWKLSIDCLLLQVPQIWSNSQLATSPNSHGKCVLALWLLVIILKLVNQMAPYRSGIFRPILFWSQVDQSEDYLLSSHANCPKFEELHAQVLEGKIMKSLYLKNLKLFRCVHNWNIVKCSSIPTFARYISKHTGLNLTDIVHLDYVYDTLLCESVHNKSLPKWTEKVFPASNPGTWPTQFKALRDLSFTVNSIKLSLHPKP